MMCRYYKRCEKMFRYYKQCGKVCRCYKRCGRVCRYYEKYITIDTAYNNIEICFCKVHHALDLKSIVIMRSVMTNL